MASVGYNLCKKWFLRADTDMYKYVNIGTNMMLIQLLVKQYGYCPFVLPFVATMVARVF